MSLIVDNLITNIRTQSDEFNSDNVSDAHILNLLNEAQRSATNIVSRKFESAFLNMTTQTTTGGTSLYDIPAKAAGRRVEKIEVIQGTNAYNLKRISHHKRDTFVSSSVVQRPYTYSIRKNQYEIYPAPTGGLTLNIFYIERPEDMVVSQGRVNALDTTNGYIDVDALGSSLSTTATNPGDGAYISIIDHTTGSSKVNLQISAIDTTLKRITVKSSGLTRSSVLNKTIGTAIGSEAAVDDYICLITGTAVCELDEVYQDYLTQYAVTSLKRRFGEPVQDERAHLKDLKEELEKMWVSRELQHRVRKSSAQWSDVRGSNTRRLLT